MKRTGITMLALTAVLATTPGTPVLAQVQNEVAVTRAEIQAERQAIVAENLPLTEEQAKAFWPLYREYRADMAKVGDRVVALIENYGKNMNTMTDPQATEMLTEFFAVRNEQTKVMTSWSPKLGKVLPPKALARFFQIENKLDAIINYEVASVVPLVKHKPQTTPPPAPAPTK